MQTLAHLKSFKDHNDSGRKSSKVEESLRELLESDQRLLGMDKIPKRTLQARHSSGITAITAQSCPEDIREYYLNLFSTEVDFHHKMAYRFEKAYRLGKKQPDLKFTMNLEILECLSEHSAYIETDHMSVFYCLFYCIIYQNDYLFEFLSSLIHKFPKHPKMDKLLELIDVYGINRLRNLMDPISQLVYHIVFYQAIDDNLRIVYSWIFLKVRFLQLRDKDALHLLQTRDFELIQRSFQLVSSKMSLEDTF